MPWDNSASFCSLDDSRWRDVALCGRDVAEDEQRLPDVVGDVKVSVLRIQLHCAGPIQLRFIARDHAQWRRVAARIERIDLDGRIFVAAGTLDFKVAVMAPGIHVQQLILLVDGDTVRFSLPALDFRLM